MTNLQTNFQVTLVKKSSAGEKNSSGTTTGGGKKNSSGTTTGEAEKKILVVQQVRQEKNS